MISDELLMLERIGVGGAAFYLVYLLLKDMQKKAFSQSYAVIELTKTIIKENTTALEKMNENLSAHIKQKDILIERIKDCRKERNEKLDELINK